MTLGTMSRKQKLLGVAGLCFLLLAGIIGYRIYVNQTANKQRANRISQGRGEAVETAVVGRRDVKSSFTFSGNLEAVWSADISSKTDGRINALNVDEGDIVRSGAVLAVLDDNELLAQVMQAEGNVYSAKASLEQAELDLIRTDALAGSGAVSQQAQYTARIKRDSAMGQVKSAEGNLALLRARLDNAQITAPRNGIIVKRFMQAGYYAKAGNPIVTLSDTTTLLAKATLGESQLQDATVGSGAIVKLDAIGDKAFNGTVTRVSPAATLPARTFIAEISIPNPDGLLKPGLFAKVTLPGRTHVNVISVPENSLVMREDQKAVFVVQPDSTVLLRIVKVGVMAEGWVEILDGLKEGERIVVGGQNKVRDGMLVTTGSGDGGSK